jgi:hypothetical protein
VKYSPSRVPACAAQVEDTQILMAMERAADGAMWIVDTGCERLIRVTATAVSAVPIRNGDPGVIAPDATGGMWFTKEFDAEHVGHADAAGNVRQFKLPQSYASDIAVATDVAVAADGSAWFALAGCTLVRVSPAGEVTTAPAPIPARRLAFDPAGGMWLASGARLVHVAPGEPFGPCDERPPSLRIGPGRDGGAVSLRALRCAGGLRLTVREPTAVSAFALYSFSRADSDSAVGAVHNTVVSEARGRTIRYRVPPAQLRRFARRLAAGDRTSLVLFASAADADGNATGLTHTVRVKP